MEFKNVQKMYKKIPKVHFFLLYFLWRYNNMNEEFKEKSKKVKKELLILKTLN